MKNKILILLLLPMLFSCGNETNYKENKDDKTLPKKIESKEKNFVKYDLDDVYVESEEDFYDMFNPNTKIYLKSNDKIISEGIIQTYDSIEGYMDIYKYNNITYKIIRKEDNIVTMSLEFISGNKWLQKEYYSDGILEEEEDYVFFKDEWYKNGIEKVYYRTGQLLSEDYNYSPDSGEEPPSFKIYKRYHLNGKLMKEHKYSFEENRLIYEKCWNEDGKIIGCEDEIYY